MEGKPALLKGINYGEYSIENGKLLTTKDNKVLMGIPVNRIINSTVVNKQDVAIELQNDDPVE